MSIKSGDLDMQRVPAVAPNAVAPAGLPTRADIDQWTDAITDLSTAAAEYRQCAQGVDAIADAHCQSLSAPGGTAWDGDSADAAREAAYGDRGIIWQATDHMRNGLARAADAGAQDIHAARSRVQDAIELAERDGYTVGNDLSVVDNSTYTVASDYDARQAKALEHREEITRLAVALVAEDSQVGEKLSTEAAALDAIIPASWGAGMLPAEAPRFDALDNVVDEPHAQFGSEVQQEVPPNRFIGDQRFGHWESVVAPPYVGDRPPPLNSQYRPLPDGDDPTKLGGTTGMYTPGKHWIQDASAPHAEYREEYKFRIVGQEATTHTRMVNDNGVWKQERWVQNVYEYQRNTQVTFNGDVSRNGTRGSLDGLPDLTNFDNDWKPIIPQEIVSLSARNPSVDYYLPDGCGGQFTIQEGIPVGGYSGLPPVSMTPSPGSGEVPPSMHRPR